MTDFSTTAAALLQPKSRGYDDFEDDIKKAVEHFNSLSDANKQTFVNYLRKVLSTHGNAAWKKSLPAENEPCKDENVEWFTVAEVLAQSTIEEELEDLGFTKDALPKAAELFYDALEERLSHDPFRQRLDELFAELSPSPFNSSEDINVMEVLAQQIEDLEAAIESVERENRMIANDIRQTLPPKEGKVERAPRRSNISEQLESTDNDGAVWTEEKKCIDPRMKLYLRALGDYDA
jgi:hypothetical protein